MINPKSIFGLCLQVLSIANNSVYKLPRSYGDLKDLRVLKLGSNHLYDLPHQMCKLPHIEEVQLFGNEMPKLPVSLNAKGHKDAAYLLGLLCEYFPPEEDKGTADVVQVRFPITEKPVVQITHQPCRVLACYKYLVLFLRWLWSIFTIGSFAVILNRMLCLDSCHRQRPRRLLISSVHKRVRVASSLVRNPLQQSCSCPEAHQVPLCHYHQRCC